MHDEAGLLVDDQQCFVFEDDIELNGLGLRAYHHFGGGIQLDQFTAPDLVPGP